MRVHVFDYYTDIRILVWKVLEKWHAAWFSTQLSAECFGRKNVLMLIVVSAQICAPCTHTHAAHSQEHDAGLPSAAESVLCAFFVCTDTK